MLPKAIPDKLPGTVLPQYVRCGTRGCHCARGELHGPYWYHFWHEDGYKLRKQYVRKADLEAVRAACAAYQEENRQGRELIKASDELMRWLDKGDSEPYDVNREVENTLALTPTVRGLVEYASGEKGSTRAPCAATSAASASALSSRSGRWSIHGSTTTSPSPDSTSSPGPRRGAVE